MSKILDEYIENALRPDMPPDHTLADSRPWITKYKTLKKIIRVSVGYRFNFGFSGGRWKDFNLTVDTGLFTDRDEDGYSEPILKDYLVNLDVVRQYMDERKIRDGLTTSSLGGTLLHQHILEDGEQ